MYISAINTSIGKLWLKANKTHLLNISFTPISGKEKSNPIIEQAKKEILEYIQGKRQVFSVPIKFVGSKFQVKIWNNLCLIPYGKVWTYQQLAEISGYPKAARATGGANHSNPLPIIIPCHRVVSGCGDIGGYIAGKEIKQKLLNLETMNCL